jgi:hypothetical protein
VSQALKATLFKKFTEISPLFRIFGVGFDWNFLSLPQEALSSTLS